MWNAILLIQNHVMNMYVLLANADNVNFILMDNCAATKRQINVVGVEKLVVANILLVNRSLFHACCALNYLFTCIATLWHCFLYG